MLGKQISSGDTVWCVGWGGYRARWLTGNVRP